MDMDCERYPFRRVLLYKSGNGGYRSRWIWVVTYAFTREFAIVNAAYWRRLGRLTELGEGWLRRNGADTLSRSAVAFPC